MINSIVELNEALVTTHCLQILGRVKDKDELSSFDLLDATDSIELLRDSDDVTYVYNLTDSIIFKAVVIENF